MLAILAMLARKVALRVAPGGSAPLFPSAARRGFGGARSEPVSTLYHYVPTEPVVLSPHVEVVDTKQKEIDELKEMVKALMGRVRQ